ncbi:hypothetical protein OIV83_000959 [Microbotryomycetes sp. JL201]|nr:hypothetical protein OIV83_000959 [Microbotryomycetes sp. JL201]
MTQLLQAPPPQAFAYAVPLSLQCVLLHPVAADSKLSAVARFLLMIIGVYSGATCTFEYGWQPRDASVGLNFVLGVGAAYAVWKAIEWGLAQDLTPYTWVGYVETKEGKAVSLNKSRTELEAIRRKQRDHDSLPDIVLWSISLLFSMRGIGWAFGPPARSLAPHGPSNSQKLIKQLLLAILKRQIIFASMSAILLTPEQERARHLVAFGLAPGHAAFGSRAVGTLAFGTSACCALEMGFSIATLLVCLSTKAMRAILPAGLKPPPFDIRAFPPIFQRPWHPESVSTFWASQWHSFFSASFHFLGFKPASAVVSAIFGKALGRVAGVTAVFALSSWLHEYALASASNNAIALDRTQLDFGTRYGSIIYFMSQGFGIVLEGLFRAITGKRVSGSLGTIWAYVYIVGLGYFVYKNWSTMGLFQNLPAPQDWSWHRWVLPLATVYPRGGFVQ